MTPSAPGLGPPPAHMLVYTGGPGLANRMLSYAGYRTAAQLLGVEIGWSWEPSLHCEARFEDLFTDTVSLIDADEIPALRERAGVVVLGASPAPEVIRRAWLPGVPAPAFEARVAEVLRSLQPQPHLQEAADVVVRSRQLAGATGMHVRFTDNRIFAQHHRRGESGFQNELFPRLVDFLRVLHEQTEAAEHVWVCSDNARAVRWLAARTDRQLDLRPMDRRPWLRLSPRASTARKLWLVRQRPTTVQHALIDLLTLSRCRKIIATYWSSFSATAGLLGDALVVPVTRQGAPTPRPTR